MKINSSCFLRRSFQGRSLRSTAQVIAVVIFTLTLASAQTTSKATKTRIEREGVMYGSLFITIDGAEKKITDQAQQAWIINDGQHVVYSSSQGAGGYEGEGQSLHLYDIRTGKHKRIMSQYYMVDKVEEVVTTQKKRALIVTLEDGGLGATYIAVVDPWRGEVFFRRWARILSRTGDNLVLGFYREDDWDKFIHEPTVKVSPYKTERHNLNVLLRRRVIFNKPDKID